MFTALVTIGYTQSDRANDYVPSDDGYRPGAQQVWSRSFVVEVEAIDKRPLALDLAEAVFVATNAPGRPLDGGRIQEQVWEAMVNMGPISRSLCVGDTVRVVVVSDDLVLPVTCVVACEKSGWAIVKQA